MHFCVDILIEFYPMMTNVGQKFISFEKRLNVISFCNLFMKKFEEKIITKSHRRREKEKKTKNCTEKRQISSHIHLTNIILFGFKFKSHSGISSTLCKTTLWICFGVEKFVAYFIQYL